MKKDNTTLAKKCSLRAQCIKEIKAPVILETHGGNGEIYKRVYSDYQGVVFEKSPVKAEKLADQRPSWAVYESDCITSLAGGAVDEPINFIDIDPYGDPWPVLQAYFNTDREKQDKLIIVVNDGLRHKLKTGTGWRVESISKAVSKYGSARLYNDYLDVCEWMMAEIVGKAGYKIKKWTGYYCGHTQSMTHYAALCQ